MEGKAVGMGVGAWVLEVAEIRWEPTAKLSNGGKCKCKLAISH